MHSFFEEDGARSEILFSDDADVFCCCCFCERQTTKEEEFFLFLFLLLVDDVVVVFDARRADDVKSEDAVSADIVIVAKTYSIAPPWIYVSDVSLEKARFENSPLLGSRPRAADSARESKSRKKKTR